MHFTAENHAHNLNVQHLFHQCLNIRVLVRGSKTVRLSCWLSRGQQVSHRRLISGIHCMLARKHASQGSTLALKPGTNVQNRIPMDPQKGLMSLKNLLKKKKGSVFVTRWNQVNRSTRVNKSTCVNRNTCVKRTCRIGRCPARTGDTSRALVCRRRAEPDRTCSLLSSGWTNPRYQACFPARSSEIRRHCFWCSCE